MTLQERERLTEKLVELSAIFQGEIGKLAVAIKEANLIAHQLGYHVNPNTGKLERL